MECCQTKQNNVNQLKFARPPGQGRVRSPLSLAILIFMGLPPLSPIVNIWGINLKGRKVSTIHPDHSYGTGMLTFIGPIGGPRLQTIPLSNDRPEMFPGLAENCVDAQRGHNARSPESLTLMLRLSMGTWTPLVLSSVPMTRLPKLMLMLQGCSGQLFPRRHLILHCRPGVFPRRPRVLHRRPRVLPHRLLHLLGVYFPQ